MLNKRIYILFLFFTILAHSQDQKDEISLKIILEKISKTHHVNFNYLEDEIVVYKISEPDSNLTLKEKLNYLAKETRLNFNLIGTNYYTISNDKKLDKPLCGYIFDNETNLPLGNTSIKITNTNISVITDEKGYFELPTISSNPILISNLGYKKQIINPEDLYITICPKLFLIPDVYELPEIITQSYLTKGISKKIDGSISIKPKEIGHLPGLTEPDIFKTIQKIPGIISVDESISNINIRGGTHDQNLILWNGIRLFQTGHFFGMISSLNPNLTNNARVIKNGTSAFYGENTSGVIDISTRTQEIEKNKAAVGINWINADFYVKLKTSKRSNIEISGRRSFTDILENSPVFNNYSNKVFQNTEITNTIGNQNTTFTNNKNFYFYDFTGQIHHKISNKTNIYLDFLAISNRLNLYQSKIEDINTSSKNSFLTQNTIAGTVNFKTQWNLKNSFEASTFISTYNIDSKNESIESNQLLNQQNKILDIGIHLKNTLLISKKFTLNIGYQFNEIGIQNLDKINSPVYYRNIKDVLRTHAGIIETKYISSNNKLKTCFGIRSNYFEEFSKFIIEPRLQINYKFSKNWSLEILGENKSQTTTQIIDLQKDFLGLEKRRWVLSNNEEIPIIRSKQLSIGFNYTRNSWLIIFENYLKKVNGITSASQGFQNQIENVNLIGDYNILGTELLVQKQINKITSWISYSLTNNEYEFQKYTPNKFPNNFEIKQFLNFATIYNNDKIKLAFGAKYHTGKPSTNPKSPFPIFTNLNSPIIDYKSPNSENLKNFIQINFSAGYKIKINKNSHLDLGLAVENLTNNKNTINEFYRLNSNNSIEKISSFPLQRTLNAFIRYNLQ